MASKSIHRKKNGAAYVYSVESYWDKEKKAPRNRQVCLGRLDEKTGNIIASGRKKRERDFQPPEIKANARIYGPYTLLNQVASDLKLIDVLKKSFPEFWEEILSLVFFLTQRGLPLSRCEQWSGSHQHPFGGTIASQRLSEILKRITENDRQCFFSLWMKQLSEDDILCYDITSISSYGNHNEYIYWGYNRDHEKLPQINMAMLFGQKSGLPAYYRRLPGCINDVVTLKATIDSLDFLGKEKLHFVLDQGFYSETNVGSLFDKRYHFILMVPTSRIWVRSILDQYYESIAMPEHYAQTSEGETLYMLSHLHKWNGRRCYLHLYFNAAKAADDFDKLMKKLLVLKKELEMDQRIPSHSELYDRFFLVKRTPKRGLSVQYNNQAIQQYRKRYAGFFCILTNLKMDSDEILDIYRQKDAVENCFDDLKNSLDMKRLRVHSSDAMDSRLFLQFLSVILISKIRMIAKKSNHKDVKYMSVREIMEAMESIVRITYSGRYGAVISEAGPLQRAIQEAFGVCGNT